jgi:hypothetical protein
VVVDDDPDDDDAGGVDAAGGGEAGGGAGGAGAGDAAGGGGALSGAFEHDAPNAVAPITIATNPGAHFVHTRIGRFLFFYDQFGMPWGFRHTPRPV